MAIIHLFSDNLFLLRALIACIGISLICPILGIFLMLRRMSLMGDAMSHAILPGVALGFMFGGMSVLAMALGGLIAGVGVTTLAGVVSRKTEIKEDASFAGFYLIALSLGVIIISKSGTNLDLMHILFGSILAIGKDSLLILSIIVSFSLIVFAIIIRPLAIDVFDKNLLRTFGVNSSFYHLIFLFLVVLNLVIDFQILGTILVIGLMMLPASCAKLLAKSLNNMLIIAILSSLIASFAGIILSYYCNLPTGPSIVIFNGALYIMAILYVNIMKLIKQPHFKH
ncbi:MAG: metal ABC transporter permease [Proteobacteria bacterium]|jgi:zinc/manganese transport system permease protein|nr:metal ABC transporter permease [Pseudomonadota bacterium]